jgi:arylsulfatase A-like enzyme
MAEAGEKPNILVIWGDDIGLWNLSCYSHGTMGYRTPNIDRLAKEGLMFTDAYGEQSCTAGRSSFITGQSWPPREADTRATAQNGEGSAWCPDGAETPPGRLRRQNRSDRQACENGSRSSANLRAR